MTSGDLSDIRATRPARSWLRTALRCMTAPLRPFFVVLVPDRNVGPEVIAGRYGLPLVTVVLCACVAAFALGARLDVGPSVRADNAKSIKTADSANPNPPELKTDREIDEEIGQRLAVERVTLGLAATLATPLRVLALAVALLLLARYIGGKPTMKGVLTVAALSAVPGAVRSLMTALVAWRQPRVFPDELDTLVGFPRVIPEGHPVIARLLAGVDVFTWWSVVILAVGFATAADLRPRKSIVAIAISFALYLAVTRLIMGADR